MNDPYENLAQAIIMQAVKDYRRQVHKLKTHPKSISAAREVADCERFFKSGWFMELSGMDGSIILHKLKEEVE